MKIISIYEFKDYKKFILMWLEIQPQKGRGFFTKLAEKLGTSNAAISQIFKGDRELNLEQAVELTEILELNEDETNYFLQLVELGRAGSVKLRKKINQRIELEQKKQKDLVHRVAKDVLLTDQVKSIYYSSWIYTGLRNMMALEQKINLDDLALQLKISKSKAKEVIQFLLDHQLLIDDGKKIQVGPKKTHLESSSPWIAKHHQNWRLKSMEAMQNSEKTDLFYSAPMSLSFELSEKIRERLPELIKQIVNEVGDSKSEVVRCLNIDWFQY